MSPLATKYNRKLCKYQVEPLQRFSWAETRQSWMSHTAHRSTLFILASWRHCMVITFYLICFLDIKVWLFFWKGSSDPQFMWPGKQNQCDTGRTILVVALSIVSQYTDFQWEKAGLTVQSGAIFCLHDPHRGILSTAWRYHWAKALAGIMNRPLRWQRLPYKGYLISQQQHSVGCVHSELRINTLISLVCLPFSRNLLTLLQKVIPCFISVNQLLKHHPIAHLRHAWCYVTG